VGRTRLLRGAVAPIDLVEAAYDLDVGEAEWLAAIAKQAARSIDDGNGVIAHVAESATMKVSMWHDTLGRGEDFAWRLAEVTERAGPKVHELVASKHAMLVAGREQFGATAESWRKWQEVMGTIGIADFVCFFAHTGSGSLVVVWNPSLEVVKTTAGANKSWVRIAAHVGAACRLRHALRAANQTVMERGEAVLDPAGRVQHAAGDAKTARDSLRDAVKAMERARGPMRRADSDGALAMWRGLVDGRWTLVDHFDTDGKRFLVAVENQPAVRDPRALTPREGSALELARGGAAPKDIAYALGVSPSNARALLASGMRTLGVRHRGELYRWRPEAGSVEQLDPKTSVLVMPETETAQVAGLTVAERDVVRLIRTGARNEEIARVRRTSMRTVANQVASILRKLGVHSREDIDAPGAN
jgi:DNA-binding CsgD family transcriptional regulator